MELADTVKHETTGNDVGAHAGTADSEDAIRTAFLAARAEPGSSSRWATLGDVLRAHGDQERAPRAYARSLTAALGEPAFLEISARLRDNDIQSVSSLLDSRLRDRPNDVAGLRLRGELALQSKRFEAAERDFRACLDYVPTDRASRFGLTMALFRQARIGEALEQADTLLHLFPDDAPIRNLKATIASNAGDYSEALALQTGLAFEKGDHPRLWLDMGHTLRMVGRTQESIHAYHRAINLKTDCGEAWWELANLKTYKFDKGQFARMADLVADDKKQDLQSRIPLLFALGKAFEDDGEFARSIAYYAQGNALQRSRGRYDPERQQRLLNDLSGGFSPEMVDALGEGGNPDPAPIFIVGMPRSGSTLVEQILTSHPIVEGTMELPYMEVIAHRLMGSPAFDRSAWLSDRLQSLSAPQRHALGADYLRSTTIHRRLRRPHFIDKLPANFAHIGLIRAILPHAKIIDVRREPLATCFSVYKQLFAHGQEFSYDLEDAARHYQAYVNVMTRFDSAGAGIHRIQYERLVANPEEEIKLLLSYLGLPFNVACLRPDENKRPVRTPSSEQVRRPINKDAAEHWKNFEQWLAPAAAILGTDRATNDEK